MWGGGGERTWGRGRDAADTATQAALWGFLTLGLRSSTPTPGRAREPLRARPGKQASHAAGGGAQGWEADYMSLHISHTGNFPEPRREGRINCKFEDKPKAKITLK